MSLPKIAVYMARGLEGGGVTNYVRHLKAYYDHLGGVCDVYCPGFTRGRPKTSSDLSPTVLDEDLFKRFHSVLAPYDAVFVMGTPHKNMPEWYVDSYIEQLAKSQKRIVFYVFDHHHASYNTFARYGEMLQLADVFLTYCTDYCKSGILNHLQKKKLAVRGQHKKFYNFFHNELLEDITTVDNRAKKVIQLTRSTLWKKPGILINSHEELSKKGWVVELLGLERSIAAATFFNMYGDKNFYRSGSFKPEECKPDPEYQHSIFSKLPPESQDPNNIYLFGPYRYFDGMKRVSESAFSCHPVAFSTNGANLGGCAEFVFLESCLLSVPIAQKFTLDQVHLPYSSESLSSLDCILSFSDDNAKYGDGTTGPKIIDAAALVDKMDAVHSSSYLQTRKDLLDLMHNVYSSKVLVPKLLSDVGL